LFRLLLYRLEDCIAVLERFIHDEHSPYPTLVKAALAHVQFETIHPFARRSPHPILLGRASKERYFAIFFEESSSLTAPAPPPSERGQKKGGKRTEQQQVLDEEQRHQEGLIEDMKRLRKNYAVLPFGWGKHGHLAQTPLRPGNEFMAKVSRSEEGHVT
jgi:hypothetical protein